MTVNTGEGFRFDHVINFDHVTIANGNLDYLGPEHDCLFAVAACCYSAVAVAAIHILISLAVPGLPRSVRILIMRMRNMP